MNSPWVNATKVLKEKTLKLLENSVSQEACNLVDGWAESSPATVREWEKDGSLLDMAKRAQEQAIEAQQRAAEDGVSHLSTWERNEIYGGPNYMFPF